MITEADILDYIKENLGFPITTIEKNDTEILDYIKRHVLKEFSKYVPDKDGYVCLDPNDVSIQTDVANRYKILDPDGRNILSVIKVIPSLGTLYAQGFPLSAGIRTYDEVPDFMLDTTIASGGYQYSNMYITWNFIHPNLIEIFPKQMLSGV